MKRNFIYYLCATLAFSFLGQFGTGNATDYTWLGLSVSWDDPANWSPAAPAGPPAAGDNALFTGTLPPSSTPKISLTNETFDSIQFITTPRAYTILLSGPGASFNILGQGINNANLGGGAVNQLFSSSGGFVGTFSNSASADVGSTGKITLECNDDSEFIFADTSVAGAAKINLGTVSDSGILTFNTSASAQSATIVAEDTSEITFNNSSTAGNSTISVDDSTLTFNNSATASTADISLENSSVMTFNSSSTASASTIDVDDSDLVFNGTSTASTSTITLLDNSSLDFNNSSAAGSSTISATGGSLIFFNNSSSLGSSTINLNDASLTYDSTVTGSTAKISLTNGSDFTVDSSISVNRLTSASSTDLITITNPSQFLAVGGTTTGDVIQGKITGDGIFDYFGTGNITLANSGNDFTGGTVAASGTIIATTDTLPVGGTVQTEIPGTINFTDTVNATFTGTLVNKGTILYTGSADIIFTGNIGNNGILIVNAPAAGSLTINSASVALASAQVNGGTLFIPFSQCPNTTIGAAGTLNLDDGGSTTTQTFVNNGTMIYTGTNTAVLASPGSISGTGALIVNASGSGLLRLEGFNTYSGATTVQDGTLTVTENALPVAGTKTVNSGAFLEFDYETGGTFSGNITNNGTVLSSGGGNTILTGNISGTGQVQSNTLFPASLFLRGNNSYSGGTHVTGGSSLTARTQSLPTSGLRTIDANGILQLDNIVTDTYAGTFTDNGLLLIATTADLTLSGLVSGSGDVAVNSPGQTITMTANNTYSGTTSVLAGKLDIVRSATGTLAGPINIQTGAQLNLDVVSPQIVTCSGALSGGGLFTINQDGNTGTVDLQGTTTFTGNTIVYNGLLQAFPVSLPADVALNSVALLDLEQAAGSGTYAGIISDNGTGQQGHVAINKQGGVGTVIMTGANTYSGGTMVYNGTLQGTTVSLQRDIVVNSGAKVDFEQLSGLGTYSGVISGPGGVVINSVGGNTGTVEFTGLNVYTGGTLVSGGRLKGDTRTLQGVITDNAELEFDQKFDGTFNGTLAGSGIVEKTGFARLTLNTNSSAFTGTTNIREGRLTLQNILGGNVVVFGGGILTGNGSIGNNLTVKNLGIVSPGNSVGTLSVGGNYHQESGGIYFVEFNDFGISDLLDIQGQATLDIGSRLLCDTSQDNFLINVPYTILTADGGRNGQFTEIASTNELVEPVVTYDPNNAFVILKVNFNEVAQTFNQQQVANQLDSIPLNPSADLQELLQAFAHETPDEARDSLSQMSGEPYTNTLLTAELANRQFVRRLFDPLRSILTENPCTPYVYCTYQPTYDLWASFSGGKSFIHGNKNARGFRVSDYEIAGGIQSRFTRFLTAGAGLSYERDSISYRVGGFGRSNTVLGALYGLYRPERFYLLGDFIFGYTNNRVRRTIHVGDLHYHPKATTKVYQTTGYVELGTDYGFRTILVQPFIGLEAGYYRFNGFSERGGAPVAMVVRGSSQTASYSRLGLHLTSAPLSCGTSMGVDLAWRYRLTSLGNNLNVNFQEFGDRFKIKGLPLQRNSFESIVYFNQELGRNWDVYLEATGEGWDNSFSYSFVGGLKASW